MEKGQYIAVPDEDYIEDQSSVYENLSLTRVSHSDILSRNRKPNRIRSVIIIIAIALVCFIVIIVTTILVDELKLKPITVSPSVSSSCASPPIRREWRSLWKEEKQDYLKAVQCLYNTESVAYGEGSLYDDFVYTHMWIGQTSAYMFNLCILILITVKAHNASSFLPWHRMFLHIYEIALVETCGYRGQLP